MRESAKEAILNAFKESGGDPNNESACLDWLSVTLAMNNYHRYTELLDGNYASIDHKLDKLSQHHCNLCKTSPFPIKRIPLNLPPISKQASDSDSRKHFERSIKTHLELLNQEISYPKDEKICLLVIFLLGNKDRDKDLDNMSKALLDALNNCLFHDDSAVIHLNLIKLRDDKNTKNGEIMINIRRSGLHQNNDVIFDARNHLKHESIT
tara:strand:+ start:1479 stop:2105 length:627 start_codon:yes stop_codon:yes gene_type:complete